MSISLDITSFNLKVRVLEGPSFSSDREKVKRCYGKKPIYRINPKTGRDEFQYWEISRDSLGTLLDSFKESEIIPVSPQAKELLERFYKLREPSQDVIESPFEFIRPPKYKAQEDYVRTSKERNKLLLAADCGLSKTYMSLERVRILGGGKTLIVLPFKSLFANWKNEINLTWNSINVQVYHGTPQKRKKFLIEGLDSTVLTTYTMVGELSHLQWDNIILDEAHVLANPSTKLFKNTDKLIKNNKQANIQLLTATPLRDQPQNLWSLTYLLYPELAGSYWAWKNRYTEVVHSIKKTIRMKSGGLKTVDIPLITKTRNLKELHEKLKSFMVRIKRDEHCSFKDSIEVISVDPTPDQLKLYNKTKESVLLELEDKQYNLQNALTKIVRLLQVSEGNFNLSNNDFNSGKLDYICDQLDMSSEKIIVWSRFKPMTEVLGDKYKDKGVIFNGDQPLDLRTLALWSFQGVGTEKERLEFEELAKKYSWKFKPGEAQFFFGTIDSAIGFSLHSCAKQFYTSFPWSCTKLEQSSSRIKRINQEAEEIFTYFLVTNQTIEPKCLSMVLEKLKVASEIVDGQDSITSNEIQELIRMLKS